MHGANQRGKRGSDSVGGPVTLLRRHCIYTPDEAPLGHPAHGSGCKQLRFEDPASQATFDSYLLAIEQLDERMLQLENQLGDFGSQEPYREPVAWLRCFRGIDTVTAVSLRRRAPRLPPLPIGAGADGLPRAGSPRVLERRAGAAAARSPRPATGTCAGSWSRPPGTTGTVRPSVMPLRQRRQGQPARVIAIADRAQERSGPAMDADDVQRQTNPEGGRGHGPRDWSATSGRSCTAAGGGASRSRKQPERKPRRTADSGEDERGRSARSGESAGSVCDRDPSVSNSRN